jgi:hypothetical protein
MNRLDRIKSLEQDMEIMVKMISLTGDGYE